MSNITRDKLHAYLDNALNNEQNARVEQALRESEELRQTLLVVLNERGRGEHSVGAIWRRERLTCPDRDKINSFLLGVLDEEEQSVIAFHLDVVACPYCLANRADLEEENKGDTDAPEQRRQRFFESSAGYLRPASEPEA
ncbi:MAG: hypothetical protein EBV06_01320 [Planctomycetia bacterium]|nr:hypothetical protein [Planctomycetia bacterium]